MELIPVVMYEQSSPRGAAEETLGIAEGFGLVWFTEGFMSSLDVHSQTTGSEKGLFSILGSEG